MRRKSTSGFTLIELLITVTVLGILAAVAVPSYQNYLNQARRADAKAVLMEAAQVLERTYTANNCYNWGGAACDADAATATGLLGTLQRSPKNSTAGKQFYDISLSAIARSTFTLQAVPKSGNAMASDSCGTYTINNAGVQGAGGSIAECWQR